MTGKTLLDYREVEITKTLAEKLLEGNVAFNRKARGNYIKRHAHSMLDGFWKINGQDILIGLDSNGNEVLINGQHRLKGFLLALETNPKLKVKMGFKYKVPIDRDTFETIDANLARTTADFIAGEDKINRWFANHIAAALRLYYLHNNGNLAGDSLSISPQHLVKYHRKNPQIATNIKEIAKDVRLHGSVLPISSAGFLYTIFSEKDKKLAKRFMTRLLVGEDMLRSNPVFQAREILVKNKTVKDLKLTTRYKLKLIFQAWNMVRKKTKGKKLECPEVFPEVI